MLQHLTTNNNRIEWKQAAALALAPKLGRIFPAPQCGYTGILASFDYDALTCMQHNGFDVVFLKERVSAKARPNRARSAIVIDDQNSADSQPRENKLAALHRRLVLVDINVSEGNNRLF